MSKLFIPVLGGTAAGLIGTGMVVSSLTAGGARPSSSASATPAAATDKAPAKASEKRANMGIASSVGDSFLRLFREHYCRPTSGGVAKDDTESALASACARPDLVFSFPA